MDKNNPTPVPLNDGVVSSDSTTRSLTQTYVSLAPIVTRSSPTRNTLLGHALEENIEQVLFIDDDRFFIPDDLRRQIEALTLNDEFEVSTDQQGFLGRCESVLSPSSAESNVNFTDFSQLGETLRQRSPNGIDHDHQSTNPRKRPRSPGECITTAVPPDEAPPLSKHISQSTSYDHIRSTYGNWRWTPRIPLLTESCDIQYFPNHSGHPWASIGSPLTEPPTCTSSNPVYPSSYVPHHPFSNENTRNVSLPSFPLVGLLRYPSENDSNKLRPCLDSRTVSERLIPPSQIESLRSDLYNSKSCPYGDKKVTKSEILSSLKTRILPPTTTANRFHHGYSGNSISKRVPGPPPAETLPYNSHEFDSFSDGSKRLLRADLSSPPVVGLLSSHSDNDENSLFHVHKDTHSVTVPLVSQNQLKTVSPNSNYSYTHAMDLNENNVSSPMVQIQPSAIDNDTYIRCHDETPLTERPISSLPTESLPSTPCGLNITPDNNNIHLDTDLCSHSKLDVSIPPSNSKFLRISPALEPNNTSSQTISLPSTSHKYTTSMPPKRSRSEDSAAQSSSMARPLSSTKGSNRLTDDADLRIVIKRVHDPDSNGDRWRCIRRNVRHKKGLVRLNEEIEVADLSKDGWCSRCSGERAVPLNSNCCGPDGPKKIKKKHEKK